MSVYDDMASDAGYRGEEAAQAARMLEEDHRREVERAEDDHADELATFAEQLAAERAGATPPGGRHSAEECDRVLNLGAEPAKAPDGIDAELWACAIGESDHDPRCNGECGPCAGHGGVPGNPAMTCLTCGGTRECVGCSVGYDLKVARRDAQQAREALDRLVTLHDGLSVAWVCEHCGQPIGKDGSCRSGLHVGPDDGEANHGRPVASTDVADELRRARRRLERVLAALNTEGTHFVRVGVVRGILAGE
jgi:hypothetical protein